MESWFEGGYSNNRPQTRKNGFSDPSRWILGFMPWYLGWRHLRWILTSPPNSFGDNINMWSTRVDQSCLEGQKWRFCALFDPKNCIKASQKRRKMLFFCFKSINKTKNVRIHHFYDVFQIFISKTNKSTFFVVFILILCNF